MNLILIYSYIHSCPCGVYLGAGCLKVRGIWGAFYRSGLMLGGFSNESASEVQEVLGYLIKTRHTLVLKSSIKSTIPLKILLYVKIDSDHPK